MISKMFLTRGANKMAQKVMLLLVGIDLSSIPVTHMVEEGNLISHVVL